MMTDKDKLRLFWRIVKEVNALHKKHKADVRKIVFYGKNKHRGSGYWNPYHKIIHIKRGRTEFQVGVICHELTHAILLNQFKGYYGRRLLRAKGQGKRAMEKAVHDARFKKKCWSLMNWVSKRLDIRWRDK